jgi:hypothetical protein
MITIVYYCQLVLVRRIIVDFGGFYFSKALFAGMPTF